MSSSKKPFSEIFLEFQIDFVLLAMNKGKWSETVLEVVCKLDFLPDFALCNLDPFKHTDEKANASGVDRSNQRKARGRITPPTPVSELEFHA